MSIDQRIILSMRQRADGGSAARSLDGVWGPAMAAAGVRRRRRRAGGAGIAALALVALGLALIGGRDSSNIKVTTHQPAASAGRGHTIRSTAPPATAQPTTTRSTAPPTTAVVGAHFAELPPEQILVRTGGSDETLVALSSKDGKPTPLAPLPHVTDTRGYISFDLDRTRSKVVYVLRSEEPLPGPDANGGVVYTSNLDGSNSQELPGLLGAHGAVWSPDGNQIAATRNDSGNGSLVILDLRSGQVRDLHVDGYGISWSADSTQLAFQRFRPGEDHVDVATIAADGTGLRVLSNLGDESANPSWSPDGSTIAYARHDFATSSWDIYLTAPDGGNLRRITTCVDPCTENGSPAWSPDGRTIAFNQSDGTLEQVAVVNADGTGERPLTKGGWYVNPIWG